MCCRLRSNIKPNESTKSFCRKLDILPNSKYPGGKRQTCSDNEADADAEKSGTEEIPVKLKKKRRKMFRKRTRVKKCVQGMCLYCFEIWEHWFFINYLHNFLLILTGRKMCPIRRLS